MSSARAVTILGSLLLAGVSTVAAAAAASSPQCTSPWVGPPGRPGPSDKVGERLLVVDTDGGADDGLALLALLGAEQSDSVGGTRTRILAVTCASGNTNVQNVTRNVLATLHTAGRLDVPVYRGAGTSLVFAPDTDSFFGSDGFGDFLPADPGYGKVQSEHAALALARMASEQPGRITLVCLGPLTNVALAARLDPKFLGNLADIFILGGSARGTGNTKAGTEFNVYMDSEAFRAVLDNVPKPAYLMPWETVLILNMSVTWRNDVLGKLGTPQVQFLNQAERKVIARTSGFWSVADGLLALSVLRPDIIYYRTTTRMDVVLGDGFARGATLTDYSNRSPQPRNVVLLEIADKSLVECLLLQLLSTPVGNKPKGIASNSTTN